MAASELIPLPRLQGWLGVLQDSIVHDGRCTLDQHDLGYVESLLAFIQVARVIGASIPNPAD